MNMIIYIDNLVKGASGQAIQNMNLMLGDLTYTIYCIHVLHDYHLAYIYHIHTCYIYIQ